MGGHHHCRTFFGNCVQQSHNLRSGFGVEIAGRFIGQNKRRRIEQCPRNDHPLLFTTRKLMGHFVRFVLHAHLYQYFVNTILDHPFIFPSGSTQNEFQIFLYRPIDQQLKILKNNTDFSPQIRNIFSFNLL
jgi:hypothetical protein